MDRKTLDLEINVQNNATFQKELNLSFVSSIQGCTWNEKFKIQFQLNIIIIFMKFMHIIY